MAFAQRKEGLAVNAFFAGLGRVLGVATAFATTALITRALGAALFGEYALVMAFTTVFYVLADGGLAQLFVRELSREGASAPRVSEIFTLRLLLLVFFLALAPAAALFFSYPRSVVAGVALSVAGFAALSLSHLLTGVFQKELAMRWAAAAEWLGRLAQFLGAGLVFYAMTTAPLALRPSAAFFLFVAAFVVGALAQFAVLFFRSRALIRLGLSFSWQRARVLLKQALPVGASLLFVYVYFRTDSIILSLYHPGAPVGFYGLAYRVLENLIFFPAAFVGLAFPRLSAAWPGEPAAFKALFKKTLGVLAIAAPAAAIGAFAAAPLIMRLLGGPGFEQAGQALKILSGAIFFIFLAALPGQSVVAVGAERRALWIYAAGAALNLALNLLFIPRYSFVAAAWTTVVTEGLVTAGLYATVWKAIRAASNR